MSDTLDLSPPPPRSRRPIRQEVASFVLERPHVPWTAAAVGERLKLVPSAVAGAVRDLVADGVLVEIVPGASFAARPLGEPMTIRDRVREVIACAPGIVSRLMLHTSTMLEDLTPGQISNAVHGLAEDDRTVHTGPEGFYIALPVSISFGGSETVVTPEAPPVGAESDYELIPGLMEWAATDPVVSPAVPLPSSADEVLRFVLAGRGVPPTTEGIEAAAAVINAARRLLAELERSGR